MKYLYTHLVLIYGLSVEADEEGNLSIHRNGVRLKIHNPSTHPQIWFTHINKSIVLSAVRVAYCIIYHRDLDPDEFIIGDKVMNVSSFQNWRLINKKDLLRENREKYKRRMFLYDK